MTNNDILRRLRYALDLSDPSMIEILRLSGCEMDQSRLTALLKKEDEAGYIECPNSILGSFLDGLILQRRGTKPAGPEAKKPVAPLTKNAILKKIRIALELHEDDMLTILRLAGLDISKSELTALFRREGHKNYKPCGDQFLRRFFKGLSLRQKR